MSRRRTEASHPLLDEKLEKRGKARSLVPPVLTGLALGLVALALGLVVQTLGQEPPPEVVTSSPEDASEAPPVRPVDSGEHHHDPDASDASDAPDAPGAPEAEDSEPLIVSDLEELDEGYSYAEVPDRGSDHDHHQWFLDCFEEQLEELDEELDYVDAFAIAEDACHDLYNELDS